MLRKLACLAAISSSLWLSTAAALGLGDIEIRSRLNQKFVASIPLTSTTAEEAESLRVTLASNVDFERAGLERSEFVSTLNFEVKMSGGEPRIEVTSKQIAREPYVSFLVDVRAPRNRLLREYTALLDPPEAQAPRPAPAPSGASTQFYEAPSDSVQRPSAAPPTVETAPPVPAPAAEPAESAAEPAPASSSSSDYGPVQVRETLWSVAAKLRAQPSISMDQTMLAIYAANPDAFIGGISGLRKGSMLRVPTADEQRAVSPASASARIAELRGVPVAPRKKSPAAAPAAPPPAEPIVPAVTPQAAPAPVVKKPEPSKPAPLPAPMPPPVAVPTPAPAPTPPPAESAAIPTPDTVAPSSTAPVEPAVSAATSEVPTDPALTSQETQAPEPDASAPPLPQEPAAEAPEAPSAGLPIELIAGGLVLLLGAGAGFWFYRKRQQKDAGSEPALPMKAAEMPAPEPMVTVASSGAKNSVRDELEQLESTLSQNVRELGTPKASAYPEPFARAESTMAMTAQLPASASMQAPSLIDPMATQVVESSAASTARLAEKVDFDVTGQFESDTVSINLDTNDPVAEADFHLAYGLYDEAALLLLQASEKDPGNTAVRVKLAEVYFAAGKAAEFQDVAGSMKNDLPAAEWQKLAILGQQLCPGAAVFMDAGGGDLGASVDLSFDEPAAPEPLELPMVAEPVPAASAGDVLDFKLEDFQLPAAAAPPAGKPSGNSLEFNLDVPDIKAETPKLELDLASFDLSTPSASPEATNSAQPNLDGELHLEDFDVAADSANISSGDAAGTKLDLARAYLDMGDKDMAKSLLDEVMQQGSAQQKQEAQALIGRLS